MCQENNSYKAQCPQCSAALYVSGTSEAYKCPVCGKLFAVRFMKKYTKVLREGTKEEVYCTDEKLEENLGAAVENLPPLAEEIAQENVSEVLVEEIAQPEITQETVVETVADAVGEEAVTTEKLSIPFAFEDMEEADAENVEEKVSAEAENKPKKENIVSKYIQKNYSKLERRDFMFAYLLVLFPVAQFLIFWLYVNASSIGLAFQNGVGEFTWVNFKMVYNGFIDKDMLGINLGKSLMRSFILWIIGEGLIFPISLITTYVLTRKILGHYIFRIIYIVPSLMGAIIWTLLIKEMVSYSGPITKMIKALGVDLPFGAQRNGLLRHEDTAFITLVTIRSIMGIVGNNAVLTGAYTRVPTELFESAELDGANFFTELFRIAIPCIWSTICTLLTFALCSIFTCDYNVYLFTDGTGGYETSTIGFQLFNLTYRLSTGSGSTGYGYPAALGVVLTMLTLPVVLIGKATLERMSENVEV